MQSKNFSSILNLFIFIAFSLGVVLGFYANNFFVYLFLTISSYLLAYFLYKRNRLFLSDIFIIIAFVFLGGAFVAPRLIYQPQNFIDNQVNQVVFNVTSLPHSYGFKNICSAHVNEINKVPVSFEVKVMDFSRSLEYSNSYKVIGRLTKKQFGGNAFYVFWVKNNSKIEELVPKPSDKIIKNSFNFLLSTFKKYLDDSGYAFSSSVFLGRRELFVEGKEIFKDAGITHLLAISGSNIMLLAAGIFFILQLFGVKFRARLLLSLIILIVYTFITGANAPVVRSTIMYSIFSLGFFFKRKINPFNSLGLAGFICLLINPLWVFDAGFQLSFLSVFALIAGFKISPMKGSQNSIVSCVKYTLLASLWVSLFITPLISIYFGRIYFLSVLHNVILIPFFSFITTLIFVLIIISPLSFAAISLGEVINISIILFMKLAQVLGDVPFTFVDYRFNWLQVSGYYVALAIFLFAWRKGWVARYARRDSENLISR